MFKVPESTPVDFIFEKTEQSIKLDETTEKIDVEVCVTKKIVHS